jgi:GNAT superfamily N-acetyltransferase
MVLEDLPAVARLAQRYFTHRNVSYSYWSLAELADHFGNHPEYCLVAELDGCLAGFGLGAPEYNDLPLAHLEWLAVEPDLRRRGIAARDGLTRGRDVESANPDAMVLSRRLGVAGPTRITLRAKDLPPGVERPGRDA